jgi:hypothetical protein
MRPQSTTPPTPARTHVERERVLRPGRRLAFAGRVSDEDEEDKSYGLEIQEDDVRNFAHTYDWDLIIDDRWRGYESGRIPLHMRQIAQNILADARAGKFDAVCFGRINRIARNRAHVRAPGTAPLVRAHRHGADG